MKIVVSACLLGENCKYNGGNNLNQGVLNFVNGHEVIDVCPEMLGGLGSPRSPIEIVNGKAMAADGRNFEKEFEKGIRLALDIIKDQSVDLAILQSRSPTCGAKQIYDGSFSHKLIKGQGIFAKALTEKGIRLLDAEDIEEAIRSEKNAEVK